MLAALRNVLGAAAVLIAVPFFFAGFVVAPLLVAAVGLAILALSAPR